MKKPLDLALQFQGMPEGEDQELEKVTKYRGLAIKTLHLWMKHTPVVPVIIGAFGNNVKKFHIVLKAIAVDIGWSIAEVLV